MFTCLYTCMESAEIIAPSNIFASLIEGIGGGGNAILALGSIVTSIFGNIIGR